MGLLSFLKTVDIFKGLTDDQLERIHNGCVETEYQHGDRLFAEGQDADRIWIVKDGEVDLRFELPGRPSTHQNTVLTITSPMALGWSSFMSPHQYKLAAYCATRTCRVLQIKKDFLLSLFENDPQLGYRVISNLAAVASFHFHRLQNAIAGAPPAAVRITVHMGTCGIAAGAREVMNALMSELARIDRQDIQVQTGGCLGKCPTEPNVTVAIEGEDPVVYQQMTPEKMRRVFKNHILAGKVQHEFVLS